MALWRNTNKKVLCIWHKIVSTCLVYNAVNFLTIEPSPSPFFGYGSQSQKVCFFPPIEVTFQMNNIFQILKVEQHIKSTCIKKSNLFQFKFDTMTFLVHGLVISSV